MCVLLWSQPAPAVERTESRDGFDNPIDEIIVTSQRREQELLDHAGNIARLGPELLDWVHPQHIQDLMNRVPGAWLVRGSGQEHQTAIRSPALGGGGACGGFLLLEDGIPVRPPGFCNVNQFIELYPEQAAAVEVIRGPGNALHGANALHGIVNTLMPMPGPDRRPHLDLEAGANRFLRGSALMPGRDTPWLVAATYAHDGGFREHSGYEQGKAHVKWGMSGTGGDVTLGFTGTWLDQQSAGFIVGKDAYRDNELARTNPDPDAFRKASSERLYAIWTRPLGAFDLDVRPYVRHSDMAFLHFERPGRPREDNGQHSTGALVSLFRETRAQTLQLGVDVDWSRSFLRQVQDGPTQGNPRQRETFPEGKHYDYEVEALNLALYLQWSWQRTARWRLEAGARLDHAAYRYKNRMLDGNTRDDETPCGFDGCIYSRPADRSDRFLNLVPNVSLSYRVSDGATAFVHLSRGFRVPQALELYRLQNGQQVSDLDTESLDSLELGLRNAGTNWFLELTAYAMRKRDSVFVDGAGYNVSGARSRHHGVESLLDWRFHPQFEMRVNLAYGRHIYDFDAVGRGSRYVSGKDILAAPRWLGSVEWRYEPHERLRAGLQLTTLGAYFLDSLNQHRYPGHTLADLRVSWAVSAASRLTLRVNNLTDRAIADRANFVMGDYRYLPGRGREVFLELRYLPRGE